VIGDDVEIGANTTIDRGALDDTVLEEGVKLDNQIQIAITCASARTLPWPAASRGRQRGHRQTLHARAAAVILGHLSNRR